MASEPKEHLFVPYSELQEGDELTDAFTIAKSYYLKSEADKVIADKDAEIADLIEKNKRLANKDMIMASETIKDIFKNLRHHKYHRCLDMAARCISEEKRLDAIAPLFDNDKECWEYGSDYWNKWHKRWLEIAAKFKEASND